MGACCNCGVVFVKLHEIGGWIGTILVFLAYLLVSFEILGPTALTYQVMNIIGATGLLWTTYVKKAWQPVALYAFWALIGVIALL